MHLALSSIFHQLSEAPSRARDSVRLYKDSWDFFAMLPGCNGDQICTNSESRQGVLRVWRELLGEDCGNSEEKNDFWLWKGFTGEALWKLNPKGK